MPKTFNKFILLIMLIVSVLASAGCEEREKATKVDLSKIVKNEEVHKVKTLHMAISAMITPKETFLYYKAILDYVSKKLEMPVELVQRNTYAEVNDLIEKGKIDVAFVCAGPYVDGKKKFGMELVAAPVVNEEAVYYSYIIVNKDSPVKDFKELKGKTFAFTDPDSNTGCLVPRYELAKMKETPDSFFGKYIYTKSHDNSIKAVAGRIVDGAAVDHLIWEYLNATGPRFTSKNKIIKKLGPFGMPPVVVHPGCDPKMKEKLKQILLNMHKDEEGKSILKKLYIDRFTAVKDSNYNTIREMQEWIEKQK